MKLNKFLAALVAVSMTAMSFASMPMPAFAEDGASFTTDESFPENGFRINIKVLDRGNTPSGIKMHIDRQIVETGETIRLADWDTSDINPYISDIYLSDVECKYYVFSDNFDGKYAWSNPDLCDYIEYEFSGGDNQVTAYISENLYPNREYPISGTYSKTLRFVDSETGEPVTGLDCEFISVNPPNQEVVYSWNTTDEPEVTLNDLQYSFSDPWTVDKNLYMIRIKNSPQKYYFTNTFYDKVKYISFSQEMVDSENKHSTEDIPVYFYEGKIPNKTGSGTTVKTPVTNTETTAISDSPATGKYSLTLTVIDDETGELVNGLDCQLKRTYGGILIAEWNTSDTPEITIPELDYWFESSSYENNHCRYSILIPELPDDYSIITYGFIKSYSRICGSLRINVNADYFTENDNHIVQELHISRDPAKTTQPPTTTKHEPYIPPIWTNTETTTATETTVTAVGNGDSNCDGKLTIADAAAILQYLGNRDKYPLSETGILNADCDGKFGVTVNDAVAVQKIVSQIKD